MVRSDREYRTEDVMATAGGVALLIPTKWSCQSVELKTKGDYFEAIAATIFPGGRNSNPFKILVVYNHPRNHFPLGILQEFKGISFDGKPVPGVLVGDTNCPHEVFGSRTSNVYGRKFVQLLNQENLVFFNDDSPTFVSNSTGQSNVLDLVIGEPETDKYIESCSVKGDIGSDHLPVFTCLKFDCEVTRSQGLDLNMMTQAVDEALENFNIKSSIDETLSDLTKIFQHAKQKSIRSFKPKKRRLPPEILQNIYLRKMIMRNRKRATSDLVKRVLTKSYNRLNHKIQSQIDKFDEMQAENLANRICEADPNKMWQHFNKYKNQNKPIEEPDTPLITPDGSFAADSKKKCDEFARHLNSVHQTPDNPLFDTDFKNHIDGLTANTNKDVETDSIEPIQLAQFKEILLETKKNSAPGDDCVSYDLMKKCSDSTKQIFCNIINKCLKENIFPQAWKEAKVRMLPKPGRDKNYAANYRPISLLSALGKMYERYIYIYLMKELQKKKFFNANQAGFIKGRSAQEHLLRLAQGISNGFKRRFCTIGIFLDVKAAFDAVWTNGLKYKINQIGLSRQINNILHSFLDSRTLRVNVNGIWSDIVHLRAGTPQGSVLSPILYLIFVNDLTENLDLTSSSASQYADDIGMWVTRKDVHLAKSKLQAEIVKVENWCRRWQVSLNPSKSKLVVFSKCPRHKDEIERNGLTIQLFTESIQTCDEAEFLGVIFDSRLTWEPQTQKMLTKAYKRLNLLRSIASITKRPKPDNLLRIYEATIRSIFEYASLCIVNAAECHIEKLQLIQNQALRVILKTPSYVAINDLHDCSGLPRIKSHLKDFAKKRFDTMKSVSPLIKDVIEEYKTVQHISENASLFDIISF